MSTESICAINAQPPRVAGTDPEQQVNSAVTGAAAASADLWANYTADPSGNKTPPGKIWVEFEAVTTPAYIRLSRTATVATTVNNGALIPAGGFRQFYLDPTKDLFVDHISTGAGVLKWRKVSPIGERSRA